MNKREIRHNNGWSMLTIKEKRKIVIHKRSRYKYLNCFMLMRKNHAFPMEQTTSFQNLYQCNFNINWRTTYLHGFYTKTKYNSTTWFFWFFFLWKQTNQKLIRKESQFFFFPFHFLYLQFDLLGLPSLKTNGTGNITLQILSYFPLLKKKN